MAKTARAQARDRAAHPRHRDSASSGWRRRTSSSTRSPSRSRRARRSGSTRRAETIEGIRLIKRELPGVFTILGVSNVSFGLAPHARAVLNSVFLHHCVAAGLDVAIVNPAHVPPVRRDSGGRARARRRSGVQSPPGRAAALHRALRRAWARMPHRCRERRGGPDGVDDRMSASTGILLIARRTASRRGSTRRACASSRCAC